MCVCVCVCVCIEGIEGGNAYISDTQTLYIYIYINIRQTHRQTDIYI